jgi:hypothetical protein
LGGAEYEIGIEAPHPSLCDTLSPRGEGEVSNEGIRAWTITKDKISKI